MAFYRRRHRYYNRLLAMLPLIFVVSAVLLLLYAVLSFLAPSSIDSESHRHPITYASLSVGNDVSDDEFGEIMFRVPVDGGRLVRDIWRSPKSEFFYGCSNASNNFPKANAVAKPNRYLLIATSGGLNQQRTGITDAVVAARILNATLVIPKLDQKSFWMDTSNFSDIFDVDWFVSFLANDVQIIKSLPKRGGKTWIPHSMCVPRKCNERCYQNRVLPVLLKRHAIQLNKFDYRLANKLDTQLQLLRCRVNYHALKFTDQILKMGEKLVQRMRIRSDHYIALHLRFEPDMLAFSRCYYGGGDKERKELGAIRRRWKTLHMSDPDRERRHGKCPLTPKEVGLMLRALGYGSDVHIYVASGEVYGGEQTLAPLKRLFPNFFTKETLTSKEELKSFAPFSSRMAALDFIVCDESSVFVTNNNGNMARILAGRRRYLGHKPTIRPNAKKLYRLFLNGTEMKWEAFASKVRAYQKGFMGLPRESRPGRGEFHENPNACICNIPLDPLPEDSRKFQDEEQKEVEEEEEEENRIGDDDADDEDEPELADPDSDGDEEDEDEKEELHREFFHETPLHDELDFEQVISD